LPVIPFTLPLTPLKQACIEVQHHPWGKNK